MPHAIELLGFRKSGQLPALVLERLEQLEVRLSRKAHEPGQAKAYLDTVSRMTSAIGKLREEKAQHKRLIPVDLAEGMVREFHGPIERGVRALYQDLCKEIGLSWNVQHEDAWRKICDRLFVKLSKEVFRG